MAVKTNPARVAVVEDTKEEYAARHTPGAEAGPDTLLDIPLSQVCPRPGFNPRKRFDEAALVGLAESIHSQGVQQPIVVRSCEPSPHCITISPANDAAQLYSIFSERVGQCVEEVVGRDAAEERARQLSECRYHIVMGERRWRASRIAGKATIPALVRNGLDDAEYKLRAIVENVQRENLDPIEEAEGYRELAQLGQTQEQIGELVGRGQTAIAKALRLLKLPADVQEMLRTGQMSVSHALAILRFDQFPDVMSLMAQTAVEQRISSKALEGNVPFSDVLERKKLVVILRYYEAQFDFKSICPNCPFNAYRQDGHQHVCLKPAHYAELQAEAQAALQEKLREASEASRLRAEAALQEAKAAQEAAVTRKDKERAQQDVDAATKAVKTVKNSLPKLRDLRQGTYAQIDRSCPAECTSACPCRSKAQGYGGETVEICVEPGRHNRLKAAQNRDAAKERRERFDALRAQLVPSQSAEPDARGLALIAYNYFTSHESGKTDAMKAAALPPDAPPSLVKLMEGTSIYGNSAVYWDALASLTPAQLINLMTEVMLRQEMHQAHEYKSDSIPRTAWWLGQGAASNDRVRVLTYAAKGEVMRTGTRVSFQGGYVSVLLDGDTVATSYEADKVTALTGELSSADTPTELKPWGHCTHCGNTVARGEAFRLDEAGIGFTQTYNPADELFCPTCKAVLETMTPANASWAGQLLEKGVPA